MAGPNDSATVFDILVAAALTLGPCGVAVVLLVLRDQRGRFSLRLLLVLMAFIAISAWAWGLVIRNPPN